MRSTPAFRLLLVACLSASAVSAYADDANIPHILKEPSTKRKNGPLVAPAPSPTASETTTSAASSSSQASDPKSLTATQWRAGRKKAEESSPLLDAPRDGDIFLFPRLVVVDENMHVDKLATKALREKRDLPNEMLLKKNFSIWAHEAKVLQILGEETMLVSISVNRLKFAPGLEPKNEVKPFVAYVCGVRTARMYDGDDIVFDDLFVCCGPYTYKTAQGGTSTVPMIVAKKMPTPTENEKVIFAKEDAELAAQETAHKEQQEIEKKLAADIARIEKEEKQEAERKALKAWEKKNRIR